MNKRNWKRIGKNAFRVITIGVVAVHFALTLAFVLPMNPTKYALQPLLNATIGKYFAQNWSLFAPDPIQSNLDLVARCLDSNEAAAAEQGKLPEDGWRDLSAPLWEQFQQNRFSAYDRLARPNTHLIRQFLYGGPDAAALIDDCRKGTRESCDEYERSAKVYRAAASVQLARIGSMYCREANPTGAVRVALKIRDRAAVPWSQRENGTPRVQDHPIGTFPVDSTVAATHIYGLEN